MRVFKTSSQPEEFIYVMALKLVIVFLINSAIAEQLGSSNGVSVLPIPPKNPKLVSDHIPLNTDLHYQALKNGPETNNDNVIELQKEESQLCYSDAVLIPILNQLLNTLMEDPTYESKVTRISALLKEYLPNVISNGNAKADTNPNNIDKQNVIPKDGLRTEMDGLDNRPISKGHVKTKIVFKYDLPSVNQSPCKDVFMKLMKSAYEAYMQLEKHPMCHNSGILKELINKLYKLPQYHGNSDNNGANNINNSGGNSLNLYDLLTPKQTDSDKYNSYGLHTNPNKNVYDLNNPYGNNEPYHTMPSKNVQKFGSHINIVEKLVSDKPRPNNYDSNLYGKNPNTLTPNDAYHYLSQIYTPNYDGSSSNIYNIYNNDNKVKGLPENKGNGDVYQYANNENLNVDNLKIPQNNLQVPINVLDDNSVKNPLDSILSILAKKKTPEEGNKLEDKPLQISYGKYQNYIPNNNQMNLNMYYPNQQIKNLNGIVYPHQIPGIDITNQIPEQNLDDKELQNPEILTQYGQPLYKNVLNQYGTPYNEISVPKPYLQSVQNNYLYKLGISPNLQLQSASNAFKLDSSVNPGVIELTYVLKHDTPLMYQPSYFVKFRIPYSTFLYNMQNLLIRKPYLKINPLKLYQELIALSNVSDISSDLKGYTKEDILKLAYKNGELVTAKLIKDNGALNHQLQMVQRLNSGMGAADIWKLAVKNNGLVKTNLDSRNSTQINSALVPNGNIMSQMYDLRNSGVGFNSGPIIRQQHYRVVPLTGGNVIGVGTAKLNQLQSRMIPQKSRYSLNLIG